MEEQNEAGQVFEKLKAILQKFEPSLVVLTNKPAGYMLITSHLMKNKQPLYFGGVQVMKNYVSFHLLPVYVEPELLSGISTKLQARMQGKSCFNFKRVDTELLDELAQLAQKGFDHYKASQYL